MMTIKRIILVVMLIAFCNPVIATPATETGRAVVERLHTVLLQIMTEADTLGFRGRVERLNPVMAETFDFQTIARIVTGKHWRALSDDQRDRFLRVFIDLSAATYASNFDGYSGEVFESLSVEEKRGNLLVKTAIVKADGDRISLNYVLHANGELWQIVNVIASGVSDLSLKRADYAAVIKSEGFDSLVAKIADKVANYTTSGH